MEQIKKEYQQKADHHCMICKEYVSHKPGDWLELHEKYDYDFDNLIQKMKDMFLSVMVAICIFIKVCLGFNFKKVSFGKNGAIHTFQRRQTFGKI